MIMEDFNDIKVDRHTHNLQNNKLQMIQWMHIPSSRTIAFGAFVKEFKDSFKSEWTKTQVYGRMDGIETFKNTTRVISLSWAILAYGKEEARDNLAKMSLLVKMLYPSYESGPDKSSLGATSISSSPLMRLKFMNLASQPNESMGVNVKTSGLVGKVDGFDFAPNFDMGFLGDKPGELLPKELNVSCQFTVLHTHPLGWKRYQAFGGPSFRQSKYPYGEGGGVNEDEVSAIAYAKASSSFSIATAAPTQVGLGSDAPDEQRESLENGILGDG